MSECKGIIYYYSGSGNTKLACEYIQKHITAIPFELANILDVKEIHVEEYDVIGFATFADSWNVPLLFENFIKNIKTTKNGIKKYSFVLNTYGCISAYTLINLNKLVQKQGFSVMRAHSLHCPENYPPMIAAKNGFEESPNDRELGEFIQFVEDLQEDIKKVIRKENQNIVGNAKADKNKSKKTEDNYVLTRVVISKKNYIFFPFIASLFGTFNGKKFDIDQSKCIMCGKCEKSCPYHAIELKKDISIQHEKCHACWACYNHCPVQAVYTKKLRGKYQYSKPNSNLIKKLGN